jgi:mRNA interferase MazF
MNHGEIYWYTFKAPDKRRPVLILTRTSAIRYLTGITIAPITTTIRGIPTEVGLSLDDGMYATCAVNLDNIQTIQKHQLSGYITRLSADKLRLVYAAIEFALGFDTVSM